MSQYFSHSTFRDQSQWGSHQLVSEQGLEPLPEASREGSSGHGESGGGSPEGRRVLVDEARILSIEVTMKILSGTILDLSAKVDRALDLSNRFDRMEKLMEELVSSKRNGEFMAQNPSLQFNPTPPDFIHQVQGKGSPNWGSNSPVISSSMSTNENLSFPHLGNRSMAMVPSGSGLNSPIHRFPASTLGSNQTPPVMHQSNFRSLMSVPEQTPEESIRFLRAIAQKYKGDSKSPEEQLQILAAAAQKYRVPKESSSVDYPPTAVHMKEVDARPIRAMKFYDSPVVSVAVQSKVISDLPKLVGNLKSLAKSNPSGGVDTVKHEVGNQSSDIDAAVQKVVSHDVASSELSLSDLLSLQEVNMSVGSLALFAGGMVHKSDSLVVYTLEEFGGPNIAEELREKIPAISAVQIFFYIYKLANSSFSINDNSSQSFIFSDSSSQASVMIWDPGKVQASSSGRPLSESVIEINSEAEALVKVRQDMREAMGELGLSFLKLGNFEIKEAIYDSQRTRAADFKRLATDVDRASRSYRELNAQSVKHLDILHQYLGMMLDVHSAFSNRPSTLLTVQTLISDLSSLHTRDEGLEAASSKMEVEKDSMFFQFLHSSKELAKETANFTFQVFIMNHNGQMVPKFSFQAKVWDSGI